MEGRMPEGSDDPDGDPAGGVSGGSARAGHRTTLVLGFDRDEASHAALAVAVDLAARLAAEIVVVHIVDLDDYPIDPDSADWEERAGEALAEERHQVEEALAGHRS